MLSELFVRNVGGIRAASLFLRPGLIAITGESGAGKSSLVRAIELVCGRRSQTTFIGSDGEDAEVHAVIDSIEKLLFEDIPPEDAAYIVRRTLSSTGRGRITAQGKPLSLSQLAGGMNGAISIQSQFAQIDLADPEKQLDMVDGRGGDEIAALKTELQRTLREAVAVERELATVRNRRAHIENSAAHLEEMRRAVKRLALAPDCEESWQRELASMEEHIARREHLRSLSQMLRGALAEEGVLGVCERLCTEIGRLESPESRHWAKLAEEGLQKLEQLAQEIEAAGGMSLGELEEARENLEARLGALRKLKRTLGVASVDELLQKCGQADDDLAWFTESLSLVGRLTEQSTAARTAVKHTALALRQARTKAAQELERDVNGVLGQLAMGSTSFSIAVTPLDKVRPGGAEDVAFYLADGGTTRPVGKTASGGELSRILLALQVSLPDERLPGTLVFDEVEAGLGGTAALLAGQQLQGLSKRTQVVLVTHEATIAALAEQHFVVTRSGDVTLVEEVEGERRITEIARMLSGDTNSAEAMNHAARLLNQRS